MKKIDGIFGFLIAFTAIIAISVGCAQAEATQEATAKPATAETIAIDTVPIETEVATEATQEPAILYDVPLDVELQLHIISEAKAKGIDPAIVMAVISWESGFDTEAVGDNEQSYGLMQIQPRWHYKRMLNLGCTNLLDPYQNVTVGIDILAGAIWQYGDVAQGLVAYNQGSYKGTITNYAQMVLETADNMRGSVYVLSAW